MISEFGELPATAATREGVREEEEAATSCTSASFYTSHSALTAILHRCEKCKWTGLALTRSDHETRQLLCNDFMKSNFRDCFPLFFDPTERDKKRRKGCS